MGLDEEESKHHTIEDSSGAVYARPTPDGHPCDATVLRGRQRKDDESPGLYSLGSSDGICPGNVLPLWPGVSKEVTERVHNDLFSWFAQKATPRAFASSESIPRRIFSAGQTAQRFRTTVDLYRQHTQQPQLSQCDSLEVLHVPFDCDARRLPVVGVPRRVSCTARMSASPRACAPEQPLPSDISSGTPFLDIRRTTTAEVLAGCNPETPRLPTTPPMLPEDTQSDISCSSGTSDSSIAGDVPVPPFHYQSYAKPDLSDSWDPFLRAGHETSLSNELLSRCVIEFLDSASAGRLALTCRTAFRLAKRRRWLKRTAWRGGVSAKARPRLWLDLCGRVRTLQLSVAEELLGMFSPTSRSASTTLVNGTESAYPSQRGIGDSATDKDVASPLGSESADTEETLYQRRIVSRMGGHVRFRMDSSIYKCLQEITSNAALRVKEPLDKGNCWLDREPMNGLIWEPSLRHGNSQDMTTVCESTPLPTPHESLPSSRYHDDSYLGGLLYEYLVGDSLVSLSDAKGDEIYRDVSRTFPHLAPFRRRDSVGQRWMYDILKALACLESAVGYCQGMNFVIAGLLLHLRCPVAVFWMALALLRHFHYRRIFSPLVPQVPLRLFQFNEIVRTKLPNLWNHLTSCGLQVDFFSQQWLMSLFAYYVEPEFVCLIWDVFFVSGWKALFKFGVALLQSMEADILASSGDEILHVIQASRKTARHHRELRRRSSSTETFQRTGRSQHLRSEPGRRGTCCRRFESSLYVGLRAPHARRKHLIDRARACKIRSSELEHLEMLFLRKKLQVFLEQLPLSHIRASHVNQVLQLPPLPDGKEQSSNAILLASQRQQSSLTSTEAATSGSFSSELMARSGGATTSLVKRQSVSEMSSAHDPSPSSTEMSHSSPHNVLVNKAEISCATSESVTATPGSPPATETAVSTWGKNRSTKQMASRMVSSHPLPPLLPYTTVDGEPLRGVVFTVDLDSMAASMSKVRNIILGLRGATRLSSLDAVQSQSADTGGAQASATNGGDVVSPGGSFLQSGVQFFSRLRSRVSVRETPKRGKSPSSNPPEYLRMTSNNAGETDLQRKQAESSEPTNTGGGFGFFRSNSSVSPSQQQQTPSKCSSRTPGGNLMGADQDGSSPSSDMRTDAQIFSEPRLATPTLIFLSLREVTARNRPYEGCPEVWRALEERQEAMGYDGFYNDDATPSTVFDPKQEWHRVLNFPFVHLGLPETISAVHADGVRMADRLFRSDNQNSKHAATITRRRDCFYFSLGLWGVCLMPPSTLLGQRSMALTLTLPSRRNLQSMSSVASVWSPETLTSEGYLVFRFAELLASRTSLDQSETTTRQGKAELQTKMLSLEKQITGVQKDFEELRSRVGRLDALREEVLQKKALATATLSESVKTVARQQGAAVGNGQRPRNDSGSGSLLPTEDILHDRLSLQTPTSSPSDQKRGSVAAWMSSFFSSGTSEASKKRPTLGGLTSPPVNEEPVGEADSSVESGHGTRAASALPLPVLPMTATDTKPLRQPQRITWALSPDKFHEALVLTSGHVSTPSPSAGLLLSPSDTQDDSGQVPYDDVPAQIAKVAEAERLYDKLNAKYKTLVKSLQGKEERLSELRSSKRTLIEAHHSLIVNHENARIHVTMNLIHTHGLWCPQLPLSASRRLLQDARQKRNNLVEPSLLPAFSSKSHSNGRFRHSAVSHRDTTEGSPVASSPRSLDDTTGRFGSVIVDETEELDALDCPHLISHLYEFLSTHAA